MRFSDSERHTLINPEALQTYLMSFVYKTRKTSNALRTNIIAARNTRMILLQILGALAVLIGISALIGWPFAFIIGGLAAIYAVERQPTASDRLLADKARLLRSGLMAKASQGQTDNVAAAAIANALSED